MKKNLTGSIKPVRFFDTTLKQLKQMKQIFSLLIVFCFCSSAYSNNNKYLDAAIKTEHWLQKMEIDKKDSGVAWSNIKDSSFYTSELYSGNSGVVLFYLELYHITKTKNFLATAERGFKYIQLTLPATLNVETAGLYTGAAGIIYTAHQLYLATNNDAYKKTAITLLNQLTNNIIENDTLTPQFAEDIIYGYSGIGLVYLYAYKNHLLSNALSTAEKIGNILLEENVKAKTGVRWPMFLKDTLRHVYYPNFSHGTAGVAYFLTCLYQQTHNKKYLDAALQGAAYLETITNDSGWIYHVEPAGTNRYYLSWCHGPAGTSRLYYNLYRITGDEKWKEKILFASQSIMQCGIPDKQTSGFWNNVSQCCGNAGVAEFYMSLYKKYKDTAHLNFAKHVMDNLLSRATDEGNNLYWVQAENRTQPELLQAQTGLMQGAAGMGIALLHLYELENNLQPLIILPDNPF